MCVRLQVIFSHAGMSALGAFRFAFADVPPKPPTKTSSTCIETLRSNVPQASSTSSRPPEAAHVLAVSKTWTKILVIGGTQFMGRHLVQQLLEEEENVQVSCSLTWGQSAHWHIERLTKCLQCTHLPT